MSRFLTCFAASLAVTMLAVCGTVQAAGIPGVGGPAAASLMAVLAQAQPLAGTRLAMPSAFAGKVIRVADGDTLTLLDDRNEHRIIRLSDIDAPETQHGKARPGQPFAAVSKAHLAALALGKTGQAMCFDVDMRVAADGATRTRYICQLTVDGIDVGVAMVHAGLAMVYRAHKAYVRNPAVHAHEDEARAARRGLWQDKSPTPPWLWRKACWKQAQCAMEGP